ncbi:MAG TPA: hypothetical protein VL486_03015 [Verrucomicrobiae bacterium]|nr:hypothetical protein [Verrucomicrobiae bacterium]
MRKITTTVAALVMAAAMLQVARAERARRVPPSRQSKSGVAVAYAKAYIGGPTLLSYGGKGTTSAAITDSDTNSFVNITFTGKYPKDLTLDEVIVNTPCQSLDYGVANGNVVSATSTQIDVEVYGWVSESGAANGETVFVTLFLGY